MNARKTNVLRRNPFEEESTINFTEIDEDFIKIFGDDDSHRYLSRILPIPISNRTNVEFQNRQRAVWVSLNNHKSV